MRPGGRGHDDGLDAFCAGLHPRLVGSLVLMTGDKGVAEDLAQDTLVRVCERWPAVRGMALPEAWAFRVATNLARSRWRRLAAATRAIRRLEAQHTEAVTDPDLSTVDAVRAAVRALPPRQRQVIALRWFAELSVAETAEAMGCAEGTVKSLTAKASATLRVNLTDPDPNPETEAVEGRGVAQRRSPVRPGADGPGRQPGEVGL